MYVAFYDVHDCNIAPSEPRSTCREPYSTYMVGPGIYIECSIEAYYPSPLALKVRPWSKFFYVAIHRVTPTALQTRWLQTRKHIRRNASAPTRTSSYNLGRCTLRQKHQNFKVQEMPTRRRSSEHGNQSKPQTTNLPRTPHLS
jgi:hypothetical protein